MNDNFLHNMLYFCFAVSVCKVCVEQLLFFFVSRQSFVKFYSLIDWSSASDIYSTLLNTRPHCLIGNFPSKHRHKSSYYFTVASSTLFVFYCFPPIDICFYMIGRAWRVFQKCVSVSVNVFCVCFQCHTKWKPNNHDL